jgi:hypothetical protein
MSTLEQFAYMMAKAGPEPLLITAGEGGGLPPNGLPGTQSALYGVRNGRIQRISGFPDAQDENTYNPRFSPNGKIIYLQRQFSGTRKYILTGSTVAEYAPSASPWDVYAYRADGVIFATHDNAGVYIYQENYSGANPTLLQTLAKPGAANFTCGIQFSADGSKLVAMNGNGTNNVWVYIRQIDGSYALQQSTNNLVNNNFVQLAIPPSGNFIVAGGEFGSFAVIPFSGNNLDTAAAFWVSNGFGFTGSSRTAFSPDGTLYALGTRLWNVSGTSFTSPVDLPTDANFPVRNGTSFVSFSGDSNLFAFAGTVETSAGVPSNYFRVWKRISGNTFQLLPLPLFMTQNSVGQGAIFNPVASYTL